jgi:hypothetical protein
LRGIVEAKVIIVFQTQKGLLSSVVQAGLFLTAAALLSACSEQPAPVDTAPARVASASTTGDAADQADVPEIVVTASRTPEG